MISGPVLALTPEGVREQLRRDRDCIESGLVLLRDGVQTSDGLRLDGLARDARGDGVVLLFALDGQHPASRALAAREFLRRSGRALARALGEPRLAFDENTRLFVIGSAVPEEWALDLRRLGLPQLELWDLDAVFVQGSRQLLVRSLLGRAADGDESGFAPPSGCDGMSRRLADELLGIVERLDPTLGVTGDRFRRTLVKDGEALAELRLDGPVLQCRIGAADEGARRLQLRSSADVQAAADAILRIYLGRAGADDGRDAGMGDAAEQPVRAPSFEALRQGAVRAQVTQEEFRMLARGEDCLDGTSRMPAGATTISP